LLLDLRGWIHESSLASLQRGLLMPSTPFRVAHTSCMSKNASTPLLRM
jgi:hypothetical protein